MKERQREQEAVGRGDLPAGEEVDGIGGEVVVGEDRALGRAGGAGGVDDARRRVAVERDRRAGIGMASGRVASGELGRMNSAGSASFRMWPISRSRYSMLTGTKMTPSLTQAR